MTTESKKVYFTLTTTYLSWDSVNSEKIVGSSHINHYASATELLTRLADVPEKFNSVGYNYHRTEVTTYGLWSHRIELADIFEIAGNEIADKRGNYFPVAVVATAEKSE